jgi:hypothetical protein
MPSMKHKAEEIVSKLRRSMFWWLKGKGCRRGSLDRRCAALKLHSRGFVTTKTATSLGNIAMARCGFVWASLTSTGRNLVEVAVHELRWNRMAIEAHV